MANKLGWFSVPLDRAAVEAALVCAREYVAGPSESFALHADDKGTFVRVKHDYSEVFTWAQAVSLCAYTKAVAFFVFEGLWSMNVFDSGQHLLFLDAHLPNIEPLLGGDVARAAELLGTDPKVIKKFHRLLVEDEDAERRAFPKDEFAAADEWGHVSLAAHFNLPTYPEGDEDASFDLPPRPGGATPLFDRLPLSVCAPQKLPKHLRYGTDEAQRAALDWAESWVALSPALSLEVVTKIRAKGPESPGVDAHCRALDVLCHHHLEDRDKALKLATELLHEWFGPVAVGAINQYVDARTVRHIGALIGPYAGPTVTQLFERATVAQDPELAMPEGDFF